MGRSEETAGKKKRQEAEEVEEEEEQEAAPKAKRKKQAEEEEEDVPEINISVPSSGRGRGRGASDKGRGKGKSQKEMAAKPSALAMLRPKGARHYTTSVALPASFVENAQSGELKAVLVGQIARALTIYSVDEVVLYDDIAYKSEDEGDDGMSHSLAFFVRNLQYLETPQYLRRQLLPHHPDLKWVGALAPLDAPHHLRKHERLAYREGAVYPKEKCSAPPKGEENKGCWVNCGLESPVWVTGQDIPADVRLTVRLDDDSGKDGPKRGVAVSPREPTTKQGLYWGFQTRIAQGLREVVDGCPFTGGYDLTIGTSERGEALGVSRLPKFQHLLLVFGGVGGLEEALSDKNSGYPPETDPSSLYKRYVNICPKQTSRTIRTEEAVMISLALLSPHMPEH